MGSVGKFLECVKVLAIENFLKPGALRFSIETAAAFWKMFILQDKKEQDELCSSAKTINEEKLESIVLEVSSELQKKYHNVLTEQQLNDISASLEQCFKCLKTTSNTSTDALYYSICNHFDIERIPPNAIKLKEKAVAKNWYHTYKHKKIVNIPAGFPKQIAHFTLLKKLGEGGFSQVFLVKNNKNNTLCALKVGLLENKSLFEREVKFLNIKHYNLVRYYESGVLKFRENDYFWIAMEYVSEYTLRDLLANSSTLDTENAIFIAQQILDVIIVLHEKKVVYRDLKPENILIDLETFSLKLTDFGLAISVGDSTTQTVDSQGNLIGTPLYMSPQVVEGQKATYQDDLWSFGVLFYELICGKPPFTGKTIMSLGKSILTEEPKYSGVCQEFKKFFSQVLNKDKERRVVDAKHTKQLFDDDTRNV